MPKRKPSPLTSLLAAPAVRDAARALIAAVAEQAGETSRSARRPTHAPCASSSGGAAARWSFRRCSAASGRGARVRLADGTRKLDFVGGIGVYAFGHADPDLLETAVVAAAADTVFQGHLYPGPEYLRLSRALLRHAGKRLVHAWLSVSGAMANENALKIVLQKHAPADHIVVFERGFAGPHARARRAHRQARPTARGCRCAATPCTSPSTIPTIRIRRARASRPWTRTWPASRAASRRCSSSWCRARAASTTAPREFFAALMQRCREAGVAVWVDEVQTFARTGELFAFRTFGLEEWVDVVTAGKTLQGSAVLFSRAYNPRPGLRRAAPTPAPPSAWRSARASSSGSRARATSGPTGASRCSGGASSAASSRCAAACRAPCRRRSGHRRHAGLRALRRLAGGRLGRARGRLRGGPAGVERRRQAGQDPHAAAR